MFKKNNVVDKMIWFILGYIIEIFFDVVKVVFEFGVEIGFYGYVYEGIV